MAARTLSSPPHLLPLYARSAAPLIPGASLLPFVPGGGERIPEIELLLDEVRADADRVAAYAKVCGFTLREHLPITYPHVLAFPLHMAVMADGRFPFGAVGLVHIENRIVQRRPIEIGETIQVRVSPTELVLHPRGRAFTLVTEVSAGGETAWEGFSTMLRRGGGGESGEAPPAREPEVQLDPLQPSAVWRLPGDLGRRYAAVSGDRNPIHMHPISAKLFGFPGAIAHGMWSKARCLAALESRLPDAVETTVRFRKPIVLPAKVQFASSLSQESAGAMPGEIRFALGDTKKGTPHLDGGAGPLPQTERSKAQ